MCTVQKMQILTIQNGCQYNSNTDIYFLHVNCILQKKKKKKDK